MKKIILTAFAVATTAFGLFAQQTLSKPGEVKTAATMQRGNVTPEDRAKQMTDRMNAVVQLTAEQYPKVMEVNKNFITQRMSMTATQPGAMNAEKGAKMKEMNETKNTQLKSILTPEQWTKWEATMTQGRPGPGNKANLMQSGH